MESYRTRQEIRQFFKNRGLRYLRRTRVAWKPLLEKDLSRSLYYRENQELFDDLSRQYGGDIVSAQIAPVEIRKIDDSIGYGVFAVRDIKTRQFIGEYAGVVQPENDATGGELYAGGYESDYSWYYLDEVDGAPTLEINGRREGNEMRFVNHGPDPNVEVEHTLYEGQWLIFFLAKRRIKSGEQLIIDYGKAYWEDGYREMID
jgi:hypothetical protein